MAEYLFPALPAVDPVTNSVARSTSGQVFAPEDTEFTTPLTVEDMNGAEISEVSVSTLGLTEPFYVEDHEEVIWKSGPYAIPLVSPQALRDAARSSADAAELAAGSAQTAAEAAASLASSALTGLQAGTGISIDSTNPQRPRISLDGSAGGSGSSDGTVILFSSLTGANDDAKLLDGINRLQSVALRGRIIKLDENRDYTFTQPVTVPSGFALVGAYRAQDQPRSSRPVAQRVLLRMSGSGGPKGWLKVAAGNTFGLFIAGLSIDGNANSGLFEGSESYGGIVWTSVFRDISIQNAAFTYGRKGDRLLVTGGTTFDGWGNINNVQEVGWNIGGSDVFFTPSGLLLDSPAEMLGFDEFLMSNEYQSNSWWSNIYCTAEGHSALKIVGSNTNSESNWYEKLVLEGRNATHPSPGALVRMEGGQAMITRSRFAFAMANPSLISSRTDQGVIHVAGGSLTVTDCSYRRGNTVTSWTQGQEPVTGGMVGESVPFIYVAAGAKVRVRNIMPTGTWTGKPVVKQALPGLADVDDSVELVTAEIADAPNEAGDTVTGAENSGTSLTINAPTNVANGDLLVAATFNRNGSDTYSTPPSGWTEVEPSSDIIDAGVVRLWYKRVTDAGAEPGSYTWSGGGSGRHAGVITRVTGAASSPLDVAGAAATGIGGPDRIICPAVTTTSDLDLLVMVGAGSESGGATPFLAPAGAEVVASAATTTGGSESFLTLAVEKGVAAGNTGSRVLTADGTFGSAVGFMAAFRSAG